MVSQLNTLRNVKKLNTKRATQLNGVPTKYIEKYTKVKY